MCKCFTGQMFHTWTETHLTQWPGPSFSVFVIFCRDVFFSRFDHEDLRSLNYHLDVQRGNRFGCM